jgi:hypothetical protein
VRFQLFLAEQLPGTGVLLDGFGFLGLGQQDEWLPGWRLERITPSLSIGRAVDRRPESRISSAA